MMIVSTQAIFKGAIDNPIQAARGKICLAVTGYPSCVTFDMIGVWFLTTEADYDIILARNEELFG